MVKNSIHDHSTELEESENQKIFESVEDDNGIVRLFLPAIFLKSLLSLFDSKSLNQQLLSNYGYPKHLLIKNFRNSLLVSFAWLKISKKVRIISAFIIWQQNIYGSRRSTQISYSIESTTSFSIFQQK